MDKLLTIQNWYRILDPQKKRNLLFYCHFSIYLFVPKLKVKNIVSRRNEQRQWNVGKTQNPILKHGQSENVDETESDSKMYFNQFFSKSFG